MKKLFNISAALLLGATLLVGCIEEVTPLNGSATPGQVGDSFAAGNMAATLPVLPMTNYVNIGEHIDFGLAGIFVATDHLTGDIIPTTQNVGGNPYYDRWLNYTYPDQGSMNRSTWGVYFPYLSYYQFIKSANDVIAVCNPDEEVNEVRGIAKAFRAYYYLDLARMFDALECPDIPNEAYNDAVRKVTGLTVPKVTETSTEADLRNNPRMTREEIFEFIFADLNDAEVCLENYTRPTAAFPSLAVVYGLKARAYLWLGGFNDSYENVPTGNEAYRLAAEYARKAITASGATITTEAQWLDKTQAFNTVISSWMWAMIQTQDSVLNNLLSFTAHMSAEAVWGYGYLSQLGMPSFNYERMHTNDFRRKAFVAPGATYADMAPYTTLTEDEFNADGGRAPYASFKFKTNGGEKYNYTTGNVTSIPMMRVEEMYLIEAEAMSHYDEAQARSLFTSFMAQRAPGYTIPAATTDLAEEIVFQKRIEFWGEGIIFYDMKRLNIGMKNGDAGSNAPSGAWYTTAGRAPWWNLPIPESAVQQNQGIQDTNTPDPTDAGVYTKM